MSIYKGGYITIDCGGGDILSEDGVTIPGVGNAIKETEGKFVILSNVNLSSTNFKYLELTSMTRSGDDFSSIIFVETGLVVTITDTDIIYALSLE